MMMAAGGGAAGPVAAAAEPAEVEAKEEKTIFTVKLAKFDAATKIKLIKEVGSSTSRMRQTRRVVFLSPPPPSTLIARY